MAKSQIPRAEIEIARAALAETELAASILVEAERWLESRGQPLWPLMMLTAGSVEPAARAGELYLARVAGSEVATFVLQWEDPRFWPEIPCGESAFLHRLAVRRAAAGRGVAPAILEWAMDRAREAGCSHLRLDCSAAHPRLCAYYEAAGFEPSGEKVMGFYRAARYQRAVEPRRQPSR